MAKWREGKERKKEKLHVGETRTIEAEGVQQTVLAGFSSSSVLIVA